MKKILGLTILLLALCLCLCYASADLNSQRTFGLFTYTLKGNGTATITGFDWETNGTEDIYIPSMIDGYVVNAIGDEAFADDFFISEYTYYYYRCIDSSMSTKVYLPDSIISIGEKAFWGSNIKMINIPAATKKIGDGAFGCCFALDRINIANGNANYATIDGALYDKIQRKLIFWSLPSPDLFPVIAEIEIPEGIKSIGKYVFYTPNYDSAVVNFTHYVDYEESLYLSIVLPSTIIEIDDYAFTNTTIASFEIESTAIDRIGKYAFSGSISLGLPIKFKTVKVCDEYSFYDASGDVTFAKVVNVGKYAFFEYWGNDSLIEISSVEHISDYAFANSISVRLNMEHCNEVGQHSFENSEVNCFLDSTNKAPIDFTINVSFIPDGLFKGTQIESGYKNYGSPRIIIGEEVKRIESKAFLDCSQNEYEIPEGVEYIALDAFDIKKDVLTVVPDSYGESWAIENGISYKYADGDDLSWLN